ncbi:MAG: DUF4189 domain-containing protein [Xanthobacteraceae bacterium]
MRIVATVVRCSALAGMLLAEVPAATADGALAVGKCDRYGYTFDYRSMPAARAAAIANCASTGDRTCEVVVTIRGACAAFVVSGECGARGWAYAPSRGAAERLAINLCVRYGGTNCTIRRWVCDGG